MASLASQPSRPANHRLDLRAALGKLLRKPALRAILAAVLVTGGVTLLRVEGWLQPAELLVYDMLRVAWAGRLTSERVVLVGATEHDITVMAGSEERRWGWPVRDGKLAALLERLESWQPRAIGVDLYRDLPEPPGTAQLDAVLREHPNIYWVFKLKDAARPGIPAPKLLRNTARAALADTLADRDHVVRRGLLFADDGVNQYPGIAMALALAYLAPLRIALQPAEGGDMRLGKAAISPLDQSRGPYTKLDSRGYQTLLDYRGGTQPFPQISMSEAMDRSDLGPLIHDRVVIVGVAAESVKDLFTTPFGTGFNRADPMNGIVLHAHLVDQLLREAIDGAVPLQALPRQFEYLWIALWGVGGAMLGLFARSTLPVMAGGGGGAAAIGGIVWLAFGRGWLLPLLPAELAWLAAGILTHQLLYAATHRQRARLRQSLGHYLPSSVIDRLVSLDVPPTLGGERREISVLFSDVANFTNFSEDRDPAELADITNHYLEGVSNAIFAQEGLVNAFMGDGVLAFFGAPQEQPDHADRAVAAALEIDRFAENFRAEQNRRGVNFGHTRIGIHTGIAFVGNIGSVRRLQYTALGDVLNTGSRLEGLNKIIGSRICVSREVVEKCRDHCFRPVGSFVVKGRQTETEVFMPVGPEREQPGEAGAPIEMDGT